MEVIDHPLDGPRLKFDRACEHVDTLHTEVDRFLKEEAHRVWDQFDRREGGYVRVVAGTWPPPKWSVLLGEIAHNFRSCLDHIVWQVAVAASPTGNPEDQWKASQVSFPIYASRRKYLRHRHSAWRHVGPRPEHRRVIRHLQPYQRRNAPESHPLWHLHSLSNIDKHQVLHTTLVGVGEPMPREPGHFFTKRVDPATGEIEHVYDFSEGRLAMPGVEMEVRVTVGGPSEGDIHFHGDLPFQIEVDQPRTVLHAQPVLRLVDGIRTEVGAALTAFEPTF